MAAQPMIFHRSHFEDTRAFIVRQMGAKNFDEAFGLLTHAAQRNHSDGFLPASRYLPCHQSTMGAYLWEYKRHSYSWHIMWRTDHSSTKTGEYMRAWSAGEPVPSMPSIDHRCPQLYVGSHLTMWGSSGQISSLKAVTSSGGSFGAASSPALEQGSKGYLRKAVELLFAALCGAFFTLLELSAEEASEVAERVLFPQGFKKGDTAAVC